MPMSLLQRSLHQPQSVWFRRVLFQVHLWTGIGVGLYVFMISVTGSAVVFRNEIYLNLDIPRIVVAHEGNGLGAVLVTVLCLSGIVLWWPGVRSWTRGTVVSLRTGWKRFNWELHSAVGFWAFLLVLMWAVTGIVVSIPEPYWAVVDYVEPYPDFDNLPEDYVFERRLGDQIFRWIARIHFGTFGGTGVKAAWVLIGLAPAALFLSR